MGQPANGYVNIYFDKEEDADKVHEILSAKKEGTTTVEPEENFKKFLGEEGAGHYGFFNFSDNVKTEVCFEVASDRVQNAEWQVDQIIKLLKKLIELKEIDGVAEFTADIQVTHESWYMEADEFNEGE